MFDARLTRRLIILLVVLCLCIVGIAVPSRAQMGGIERSVVTNAVQNATQSARDRQQSSGTTKSAKADSKAKDGPELAAAPKQRKESKKPTSGAPQQTTRNPSGRAAGRRTALRAQ